MNQEPQKEFVNCLYCNGSQSSPWATENGYVAVKCTSCGLIYVNPRPPLSLVADAVKTGVHSDVAHGRTAIGTRNASKVRRYKSLLEYMFKDIWATSRAVSWIDVGAGYGELMEAVAQLAPKESNIVGLEPMKPKVESARMRGLNIKECYLHEVDERYDFVSVINVYSHIPDFREFLKDLKKVLNPGGEILIETGNTADLEDRQEVPGDLDLPDHLAFAGESHLRGYLAEAGFSIVTVRRIRVDDLLRFAKNVIKNLAGRKNVPLRIPYTSPYRSLVIRARLN